MTYLDLAVRTFLFPVLLGGIFILPPLVVGWFLHSQKKAYHAEADEPFTRLPLRPPGESLRVKIVELSEQFDAHLLTIVATASCGAGLTIGAAGNAQMFLGTVAAAATLVVSIWCGRQMVRLARELWSHRLGFTGERVVGEELNQLLAAGFRVFHDVVFDSFNIDHVIVGPPGVYIVETKARRKPAHIKGPARARITFDGEALHFANGSDRKAVKQALRNASTLAEWLTEATGEPVQAKGILTFPGWFIEPNKCAHVQVMNPEFIKQHFLNHPRELLGPEQIQRIAHQLTERCRMVAAK